MGNKKNTKSNDGKFVVFDLKSSPQDYNMQVLTNYAKAIGVDPMVIGVELGELHNHMMVACRTPEQEARMISLWNRILDFYVEAGTWNGSKKTVKFKFTTMTKSERDELEKEIINETVKRIKKPKKPSYSG